MWIRQCD